jgi:hypothetical protein
VVRPPCEVPEYLPIRRGSRGSYKPFSWLSEGVSAVFTISTEYNEIACVLHTSTFSGSDHHVLVVGGAGKYSFGMSPRNVCRNAWETVVL